MAQAITNKKSKIRKYEDLITHIPLHRQRQMET